MHMHGSGVKLTFNLLADVGNIFDCGHTPKKGQVLFFLIEKACLLNK